MITLTDNTKRKIARDALIEAKFDAPFQTGAGMESLDVDVSDKGFIFKFGRIYMWFQHRGTKGFMMWSLAGKVIPIRDKNTNQIIFRYCNPDAIGQHRIRDRDPRTGRILPGNNPYRWRHPGIKKNDYVRDAIKTAVRKNVNLIVKDAIESSLS